MADVAILEIPNFPKAGKTFTADVVQYEERVNPRDSGGSANRFKIVFELDKPLPDVNDAIVKNKTLDKVTLKFTKPDAFGDPSIYMIIDFLQVHFISMKLFSADLTSPRLYVLREYIQLELKYGRRVDVHR